MSTPAAPLDEAEEAVWRAFTRAMIVVRRVLDADLQVTQQLSLTEYVVLVHLSETPQRRLRMSELAGRADLSLSGMTRIVARLAAQGLVERTKSTDDARGAYAVLTDDGFARLESAYPSHLASVRRHVVDHLAGLDLHALARAMDGFATKGCSAVEGPGTGAGC